MSVQTANMGIVLQRCSFLLNILRLKEMPKKSEFRRFLDKLSEYEQVVRTHTKKEVFAKLEKHFTKGYDDFCNRWTIDIDKYAKMKKKLLNER